MFTGRAGGLSWEAAAVTSKGVRPQTKSSGGVSHTPNTDFWFYDADVVLFNEMLPIPKLLEEKEIAHTGLTELHVVSSMHERKSMMAALSDGFIAMPGGFGTLEEIIEIVTWGQLKFHDKPCGLLNTDGYFDQLLAFLDHTGHEGFLKAENRRMLMSNREPQGLIGQFERYTAPRAEKWL